MFKSPWRVEISPWRGFDDPFIYRSLKARLLRGLVSDCAVDERDKEGKHQGVFVDFVESENGRVLAGRISCT